MSSYHYHQTDAIHALQSAGKAISNALTHAGSANTFHFAIWEANLALRKLALAQMKLMQAKSEHEVKVL